ncbi:uncharacterized protein LY79DRAFT_381659 [Colletotrichum navitas]|uniref:Uncharacterized protein n=1 Tax=Colletotrichum navitas TaxID=681940 RepID=A0AAD8Q7N3_9PEZI|nr:uncharacterized protein LY79DRAFT_381659 [Colletotrichum navitas]KAK1597337.1 hypothetical protein LY79DRAFT_381659 [Colletotrichum navitas]
MTIQGERSATFLQAPIVPGEGDNEEEGPAHPAHLARRIIKPSGSNAPAFKLTRTLGCIKEGGSSPPRHGYPRPFVYSRDVQFSSLGPLSRTMTVARRRGHKQDTEIINPEWPSNQRNNRNPKACKFNRCGVMGSSPSQSPRGSALLPPCPLPETFRLSAIGECSNQTRPRASAIQSPWYRLRAQNKPPKEGVRGHSIEAPMTAYGQYCVPVHAMGSRPGMCHVWVMCRT